MDPILLWTLAIVLYALGSFTKLKNGPVWMNVVYKSAAGFLALGFAYFAGQGW